MDIPCWRTDQRDPTKSARRAYGLIRPNLQSAQLVRPEDMGERNVGGIARRDETVAPVAEAVAVAAPRRGCA